MKPLNIFSITSAVLGLLLLLVFSACRDDDDGALPITNDLRVLQVNVGDNTLTSGATGISVLAEPELVFSHGLNASAFAGALSISPSLAYTIGYDATNSFATISFTDPLAYETEHTINLPRGTYGAGGEASVEDFTFRFTTAPFEAPAITLATDAANLFEGESVTLSATIDRAILEEVSLDLVFAGSAERGTDYTVSAASITIPSGSTSGSVTLSALNDAELEGEETLTVALENLVNAVENQPQVLTLLLGDTPPSIELKGVFSFTIGGTSTNGRGIHLRVLEDIADLSLYGIGIANNGGGSDGREIDFPAISVAQGDDILLARDIDVAGLTDYFGPCFTEFEHVVESGGVNFNGDDPFELYRDTIVIESYGDVELDGTGLEWEWTGTWAYKLNGEWEYGPLDCSANSTTTQSSDCPYPFCSPLQLQGVLAILWDGSGTNGGKGVQVRANRDIADLSRYGIGVANNGGGTDGIEYTFPAIALAEGEHLLLAREPETIAAYFGACFDAYAEVIQTDAMNQNGDDAIELFDGMDVIETYGNADVDGTGEVWEYAGSWAYKLGGQWITGGVDCAAGSTSTLGSACPYLYCN